MAQQPPERPAVTGMTAPAADAAIAFPVRIGHAVLAPAATFGALRAAIDRSNRDYRLADLGDHLNPDVIDADKAAALVAALPAIAKRSPQLLGGRELYLNPTYLRIGTADPTTAAGFAQPFDLETVDLQGQTLLARATVPTVPDMARERAAEAKSRLTAEHARIGPLEARLGAASASVEQQRAILGELTPARSRRSALARVWWNIARDSSERAGTDAAAKAEAEAALKAVNEYLLPTGAGMSR